MAELVEGHKDELARLEALEAGKSKVSLLSFEIPFTVEIFKCNNLPKLF